MSSWFFKSCPPTPIEQPARRSTAQSLLYYQTGSPPPSARVDPKLKHQPRRPLRLWDYWKFGVIVAAKATEVTTDVLSHHIWGPRRKSWGIEMTIVTSLIRGAERHSSLVDIGTIRMLMSIGGLVPLPSDALVTPVTFRVKSRKLPGILEAYDSKEDGTRELCGEWVVGRKTWQRMQTEWKASNNSNPALNISLPDMDAIGSSPKRKERVVLYIHGGAYYLSSAAAQRIISIPLAKYTDARVFALDYRLAPETRFPGPLHDVVSGYFRLVEDLHIPPENIIIAGDSAGGGLALALLMYLRDNGYALPSGAILMSPWVDLTMSCESWDSNAPYDVVPCPSADNHMNPIALYLGDHTEEYLTHPYASPLFGDFKGLPPLLVQAGDAEVLRDEITLLAHKATLAGVQVMHELYEDAIHVFQAYPFLDATKHSYESMRNFVKNILPQYQTRSPQLLAAVAELGMEQEIQNEHAVLVDGDGVETSAKNDEDFVKRGDLGAAFKARPEHDSSEGELGWVRSPTWPAHSSVGMGNGIEVKSVWKQGSKKGNFEIEHIEDVDVPRLQLSEKPPRPSPHHSASVPNPPVRPPLPTATSNSSIQPPSSTRLSKHLGCLSSSPVSDPNHSWKSAKPRRIKSATALTSLMVRLGQSNVPAVRSTHLNSHSQHKDDQASSCPQTQPHIPKPNTSPVIASDTQPPPGDTSQPRSVTLFSMAKGLAMSTIQSPRPSQVPPPPLTPSQPSARTRGLSAAGMDVTRSAGGDPLNTREQTPRLTNRRSLNLNLRALIGIRRQIHGDDGVQLRDPDDLVRSLVEDWRRLGPANETKVFSAKATGRNDVYSQ